MKLIILQEKLKEGLSIVEKAIAKSLSLPILNNVLLESEKNFLGLTATDLEIGIKWCALSKTEEQGRLAVPARVLSNFVSLLPNKKITLSARDNALSIECEKYQTKIKGFNPDDFPIVPKVSDQEFVLVENPNFCQALSQISDIASVSSARPEISGVYFLFQKDSITMTATDSFRLGEKTLFSKTTFNSNEPNKQYSLILPQKAAREIINIFGEKKEKIKIYFSPNQVMFEALMPETKHHRVQLTSRLIEGEYPNYKEIIPKDFETRIVLSKKEFLNQIKAAALFSGKINEVKFRVSAKQGQLKIFSQNPELGEYNSLISGRAQGKDMEISFNHRFLADGLANIKSSEVALELNGESGPGVIRPVGDKTYLYVVMPIKLS